MKLWEVIKELTEDPKKKFEQRGSDWVETIGREDGFLVYTSEFRGEVIDRGGITENADLNESDWQPVRQPVTWQEAIQAWADGKTVTCKTRITEKFALERYDISIEISHDQVTDGIWYVED